MGLYQQQVANYVGEINRFVMELQRYSERKIELMAASSLPNDINQWYVRNSSGGIVSFSAFATSRWWGTGSPRLERYNGYS